MPFYFLQSMHLHRPAWRVFFGLLVLALALAGRCEAQGQPSGASASAASGPKRVVILLGTDPLLPAVRLFDDAFRKALIAQTPGGVTFFTDTLDAQRFSYASIAPEFLALQRKKYASQRIDLVVGIADGAVDFIRDHGSGLWPGAPILLTGIDDARTERSKLPPAAAALLWRLDIDGTLALVEKLQPAARRLIIIGGSADFDRDLTARVAERVASRSRWQMEVWDRDGIDELRVRAATLDRNSAVVFTSILRDSSGRAGFGADAMARIAETSQAPIYGLFGSVIGRGAVAGQVVDLPDLGRRAAQMAASLLAADGATAPAAVSVATPICVADHLQLQTHGLDAAKLPAGCGLLNPPRNLWTEYRGFVLAAAAGLLLQTLTIAGLLVQRRRRRAAESDAAQRRLELGRSVRFAAMGELTASIAHEINQPLGAILSNADAAAMLLRAGTATSEQLQDILSDIRRDDLRAHEVIRRLRALLEKNEVEQTEIHLHTALNDVMLLLDPEARRRGVAIEHRFEAGSDSLLGDAIQLQQVLLNLGLNAMDAMEKTAAVARRLSIRTVDRGDAIELSVADRGSGIEPAQRDTVFESFYTTKPHGMGLGLSIVRAIVEAHEGQISVAAREGGGTVFCVRLPRRLAVESTTLPAADAEAGTPPGSALAQKA